MADISVYINGVQGLSGVGAANEIQSLKYLTQAPSTNMYGATTWDVTTPSDGWIKADGSVQSQFDYPELYAQIGLVVNGNVASTWSTATALSTSSILATTYGAGLYLYAGTTNSVNTNPPALATSTDRVTWTARTPGILQNINAATYGGGLFVLGSNAGQIVYSNNGTTWTVATSLSVSAVNDVIYGNNLYVYAGNGGIIATSTNAITWTARTSGTTSVLYALLYDGARYFAAGVGGVLRTSTDAITWTTGTSGTTSNINSLLYSGSGYVMVGTGGMIRTSKDGITWTARTSGTTSIIYDIAQAYGVYVASAAAGTILVSADEGVTWTIVPTGSPYNLNTVVSNGLNEFLVGGNTGTLRYADSYLYDPSIDFVLPQGIGLLSDSPSYIYLKGK